MNTRIVKLPAPRGGEIEPLRAEIEVTDEQRGSYGVHLYESYWAPLTEGQVTQCGPLGSDLRLRGKGGKIA